MWSALDTAAVTPTVAGVLRFILTTAQRPGEVCTAEWTEIDSEWWTIPGGKTKNGLAHRVPLSRLALEILSKQPTTALCPKTQPWSNWLAGNKLQWPSNERRIGFVGPSHARLMASCNLWTRSGSC